MKILVTVFFLFFLSSALHAQTSPKQQKIKSLFSLMQQDVLINKIFDAMGSSMAARFSSEGKDSAYLRQMADALKKGMEASKSAAKKLLDVDMVIIYDKYFTEKEIDDFIAFYKSPSGQKMISTLPDIQRETMTIMEQKYGPEIEASFSHTLEQVMKDIPGSSTNN
jgi:uncharacterized protein